MKSHKYFCDDPDGSYFNYTGEKLAHILLNHEKKLPVWIKHES